MSWIAVGCLVSSKAITHSSQNNSPNQQLNKETTTEHQPINPQQNKLSFLKKKWMKFCELIGGAFHSVCFVWLFSSLCGAVRPAAAHNPPKKRNQQSKLHFIHKFPSARTAIHFIHWTVLLGPQCAQQIKSKSIFPLGREDWIWFVLLMRGGCPHSLTNKFTNLSYL